MLSYSSIADKINKVKSGELSLAENVKEYIARIHENKKLNAFNSIFEDESLKEAEKIDAKIKSGKHGKLAGAVIAVKDVLSIKNKPTTCSSKILKDFTALYTATAVQKLIDEDAIIIGKTNCDEFAMGSSNENSAFGNVLNPADNERVPGGSSGGSAAAVAADLCDAALGTDTGGSVRQPAAFCGVFGLKPSYGRVSRYGLTAFASSFDCIGTLTKNAEDAALILEVISGKDKCDSTSYETPVPEYSKNLNFEKKFKIGLPKECFGEGLSEEIKKAVDSLVKELSSKGFEIVDITLPHSEYTIATYYILTTAEASSNLARYDGAKYGYRSGKSSTLIDMYKSSRSEGFGTEVKRRIMLGTYVLSAGYYDAYYLKAQKVRRLIKNDFDKAFEKVDLILTPTAPTTAFKIGEKSDDPLEMYLSDIYTTSANLAGIPGISFPYSKDSNGLPIGLQFLSKQFDELSLLQMSSFIQKTHLK
ncbi:MAG: aspartyl/glutamyl-tRNA amidotransferase subunit A [Ignavibacteria bacterium GWA2_35_9]|nr:MAG: aspartyl/glutamyl-tRNA amidotransferase subunit A [Ignavibacteria bacterium GWA2_35_9]OGU48323.1 MAG: aspartyl/glutamyl-tRNA amidotransferase subunit A [Ignavibacteria bacterium GWC2_36_12]